MDDVAASSVCSLAKVLWQDRDGEHSHPAIVFEQTPSMVRLSTTVDLPRFGRVRLKMGGLEYRARVESVTSSDLGNEAELSVQEARRLDERLPRQGEMRLTVLGRGEAPVLVRTINYSSGGFQIEAKTQLQPETVIGLDANGVKFAGIVRYCNPGPSGFVIGVELIDDGATL